MSSIADYLDVKTPTYNAFLSVTPQKVMYERGEKDQKILRADDRSDIILSFSDDSEFKLTLLWEVITKTEADFIFDFFHNTAKANQYVRTFKFTHPTDSNIYIVRFDSILKKNNFGVYYGYDSLTLKVVGKAS